MKDNIAKIRAALEYAKSCELGLHVKCNEALAALAELEKAAAEPVATLVGFDVESGRPVDIAWHTDCAAFNSGDKLYATPPPAKPAPLGPALGLVEIREPTPEECERIARLYFGHNASAHGAVELQTQGRGLFNACRAVMWPKEGL